MTDINPKPTPRAEDRGPFRLNEYVTNRARGGPEDGGWWYDTGRFVRCHGTFATREAALAAREAALAAREALSEHLAARREGRHPPGDTRCTGWPDLLVERHPGASFPTDRPQYR